MTSPAPIPDAPPWHLARLCAYDLETDGPDPMDARIVTAAVISLGGGKPADAHTWVAAPTRPIPDEAAAIHGWTTERASAEGIPAADAVDLIAGALHDAMAASAPIVSHNAAYDWTVLACELRRHGLPSMEERLGRRVGPVVDTFVLDKACDPYRKGSRKLVDAAAHYRVALDGAHDATADATCAARIAYRIAQAYPDVAAMAPWVLHDAQVKWAAAQATSLAEYFRRQGKTRAADGVDGDWPVRGAP